MLTILYIILFYSEILAFSAKLYALFSQGYYQNDPVSLEMIACHNTWQ